MRRFTWILIALFVCLPVAYVAAQEEETPAEEISADVSSTQTGSIRGAILDTSPESKPISNAKIYYRGVGMTEEATVDADTEGNYEITGLQPGSYVLRSWHRSYTERKGVSVIVTAGGEIIKDIKMREKDTPVTYFRKMGITAYPLLLCSILMLTYIIERIVAFYRARTKIATEQFIAQITEALRNDNIMEAVSTCEEAGGPLANVLKAGLLRYSQGMIEDREVTKEEIQEAIEEAGLLEIPQLERNLAVLGTIAVIAPLLGLLGTVTGMIKSFTTIALEGTGDPQQLAGGISEALLTTATGLTIAIPTLSAYNYFDARVSRFVLEIEQVSTEIINSLLLGRASKQAEA
jgi:biopolymer transport protein ExbB